jgi:hypothetical protein
VLSALPADQNRRLCKEDDAEIKVAIDGTGKKLYKITIGILCVFFVRG